MDDMSALTEGVIETSFDQARRAYDVFYNADGSYKSSYQYLEEWTEYICTGCRATFSARPFAISPHTCSK